MYLIRQYGTPLAQRKHKWPTHLMLSAEIFLNTSSVLWPIHYKAEVIGPVVYHQWSSKCLRWATLAQSPIPYQKPNALYDHLKCAFLNNWWKNFGELNAICQSFLLPKFFTIWCVHWCYKGLSGRGRQFGRYKAIGECRKRIKAIACTFN